MNNQIPESIKEIIKNLKTQDNRITNLPIFTVQKKETIYGFDDSFSSDFIWVDDGEEVCDEDLLVILNKKDEEFEAIDSRYEKRYYITQWINIQPFFTEIGAQNYINCNGHNLGGAENCRIYVESGWRNQEWQDVREFLLSLE